MLRSRETRSRRPAPRPWAAARSPSSAPASASGPRRRRATAATRSRRPPGRASPTAGAAARWSRCRCRAPGSAHRRAPAGTWSSVCRNACVSPRMDSTMSQMGSCAGRFKRRRPLPRCRIAAGTRPAPPAGSPRRRRSTRGGSKGIMADHASSRPASAFPVAGSQSPDHGACVAATDPARARHRRHPDRQGDGAQPHLVRLLPRPGGAADGDGPAARRAAGSSPRLRTRSRRMPSADVVDLSRLQFAVTALYHFLFVPLTLGLSWILVIMESVYVMTGQGDLPRHDEVLGEALRHQFRDGRHHRDHDGVPVRHELGVLLALRRRHLRRAAGARGADGVLHGVDVRRPVLLRLGPAAARSSTCW